MSKGKSILIQMFFWIISFLFYLAVLFTFRSAKNPMIVTGVAFVVFYTVLGIFLKKHFEISEPKITWIQFGGFFTIISAIITLADVVIKYSNLPDISASDIPAFAVQSIYIVIAVPALIFSLIIRLIINAVKNKSKSN